MTVASRQVPDGIRYARFAGKILGVTLLVLGLSSLIGAAESFFADFKAIYFIAYGSVLILPFKRMTPKKWKWSYGLLVVSSVIFVFVMVIGVIFDYMAADARGERLGVPGLEGTLIFLALLQVPVVLFQRQPDLLD